MQQGLPDVGEVAVDQGDERFFCFTQPVAELRGEFEAAGAAADDDDMVQVAIAVHPGVPSPCLFPAVQPGL